MRTVIPLLVLAFASPAIARTNEEILAEAQTAFRTGVEHKDRLLLARVDFSRAADAYYELHERGVRSSSLYRNLGNAAVLADRWPEGIWAYQMGLALDPNDRAMREHLAFARGKVIYPVAGQGRLGADAWPVWLPRPTFFTLFTVFAIAYLLACIAGAGAFAIRKLLLLAPAVLFALIAIAFGIGAGIVWEQANADRAHPRIIVADKKGSIPFYLGNGPSYPQHTGVPLLPRGLEARIVHRRGDWLQIRLATGEVGWLPRNQVLIVEP